MTEQGDKGDFKDLHGDILARGTGLRSMDVHEMRQSMKDAGLDEKQIEAAIREKSENLMQKK